MVSGLSMGVSLKLRECRGRLNNFKARNTADPMHGVVNPVGESSKLMGREIPWTKNKLGVNFVSRKALWGRTVSMRLSKTIFKLVVTLMSRLLVSNQVESNYSFSLFND